MTKVLRYQRGTDPLSGRFVSTLTQEERTAHRRRSVARYNRRRQLGKTKALSQREWNLWHKYGLTLEDFEDILKSQDNCCAICWVPFSMLVLSWGYRFRGSVFHVDHDHKTGVVRGVLCFLCNSGLGKFQDKVEVLERATEYIKKHRSESR